MDILIYGTVNSVVFSLIAVGFTLVYGVAGFPTLPTDPSTSLSGS